MKKYAEKSGSALTWAIVVTMILVMVISTMTTVAMSIQKKNVVEFKHDQAYLTARSAVDAMIVTICDMVLHGSETEVRMTENGKKLVDAIIGPKTETSTGSGIYEEKNGTIIEIENFFSETTMGTCDLTLERVPQLIDDDTNATPPFGPDDSIQHIIYDINNDDSIPSDEKNAKIDSVRNLNLARKIKITATSNVKGQTATVSAIVIEVREGEEWRVLSYENR